MIFWMSFPTLKSRGKLLGKIGEQFFGFCEMLYIMLIVIFKWETFTGKISQVSRNTIISIFHSSFSFVIQLNNFMIEMCGSEIRIKVGLAECFYMNHLWDPVKRWKTGSIENVKIIKFVPDTVLPSLTRNSHNKNAVSANASFTLSHTNILTEI